MKIYTGRHRYLDTGDEVILQQEVIMAPNKPPEWELVDEAILPLEIEEGKAPSLEGDEQTDILSGLASEAK